jgi:hypothetical protein
MACETFLVYISPPCFMGANTMQALFTFSQMRKKIILKSNLTFGHQNGLFKSLSLYWYPSPVSG